MRDRIGYYWKKLVPLWAKTNVRHSMNLQKQIRVSIQASGNVNFRTYKLRMQGFLGDFKIKNQTMTTPNIKSNGENKKIL